MAAHGVMTKLPLALAKEAYTTVQKAQQRMLKKGLLTFCSTRFSYEPASWDYVPHEAQHCEAGATKHEPANAACWY